MKYLQSILLLLSTVFASGSIAEGQHFPESTFSVATIQNSEILVLPSDSSSAGLALEFQDVSFKTSILNNRYHIKVHQGGETYTASLPMGEYENQIRLVFNVEQSRFDQLLPSVRVELEDYAELADVIQQADGIGGKSYPMLGYAVIQLPPNMHPLEAVDNLKQMQVVISAEVRVRGQPRQWR